MCKLSAYEASPFARGWGTLAGGTAQLVRTVRGKSRLAFASRASPLSRSVPGDSRTCVFIPRERVGVAPTGRTELTELTELTD